MKFTVYSTAACPYCTQAKALLKSKNITFEEIHLDQNRELMMEIMQKTGHRTVPMIFAEEIFIGGFDDLRKLNDRVSLDKLTKADLQ
jgi:glutaredoxin 3